MRKAPGHMTVLYEATHSDSDTTLWQPDHQHLFYTLPTASSAYEWQVFQHHALHVALEGWYTVPLQQPCSILDVGCGPGHWAHEMCFLFPQAMVVGFDIDPTQRAIQPPPNYHFVQGSVSDPLPFAHHAFDYVHQRMVMVAVPSLQWPHFIRELVRVTAPGGWIELVDIFPGLETRGVATAECQGWIHAAHRIHGIEIGNMTILGELLASAGLVEVNQRIVNIPLGARFGRAGLLMEQNQATVYSFFAPLVEQTLSIPRQIYLQGWRAMREEWKQVPMHVPLTIVTGRTPVHGPW